LWDERAGRNYRKPLRLASCSIPATRGEKLTATLVIDIVVAVLSSLFISNRINGRVECIIHFFDGLDDQGEIAVKSTVEGAT
jgi:hypothetical protein